jgi:hypothetical protein
MGAPPEKPVLEIFSNNTRIRCRNNQRRDYEHRNDAFGNKQQHDD